jgi:hypothetical protein
MTVDAYDLYGGTPPHSGGDTSRAAAESIRPHVSPLQALVLARIARRPRMGATCEEIEELTGLRHQTASARICELKERGRLEDSGLRRPTRSGRSAIVWRVRREDEAAGERAA